MWGDAITEHVEVAEGEEGVSHALLLLEAGGPLLVMTGVGWGRGWDGGEGGSGGGVAPLSARDAASACCISCWSLRSLSSDRE